VRWFTAIRHIVVFLLGVLIIIDGLVSATNSIPKLIIGMVMVGVLPIESFRAFRSNQQSIDARPICDIEHRHEAPE
jgi:hypothetical protein